MRRSAYACSLSGVPYAQVRAMSNLVERRNREGLANGPCHSQPQDDRASHPRLRMTLSLGFSPCPNDCFMFDAIVHQRIDLEGLEFDVVLADVETLNRACLCGETDVTKFSFHAYAHCADSYVLLDAGSALGRGCGPLLISRRAILRHEVAAGALRIAIPGAYTTANFLLVWLSRKATRQDRGGVLGHRIGRARRHVRCRTHHS